MIFHSTQTKRILIWLLLSLCVSIGCGISRTPSEESEKQHPTETQSTDYDLDWIVIPWKHFKLGRSQKDGDSKYFLRPSDIKIEESKLIREAWGRGYDTSTPPGKTN